MLARLLAAPFIGALFMGLSLASGALAADPVFPAGSRIGLVPPPGLVVSNDFQGFEDRDRKVAIVMMELAGAAYPDIEKGISAETLKEQGPELDSREDIALPSGHGFLLLTHQGGATGTVRKWILVGVVGDLTVLIRVEVPEAARDAYPDDAIRSALSTIAVRSGVPTAEQLALLPYRITELAGFRVVRTVQNGAALLTEGPKDVIDLKEQPVFMINVGPAVPEEGEQRASIGRRLIATTPGVKEMRIERAEPLRVGGQPGQEMIVQAKDAASDTDLTVVQWLRFGSGGSMRLLGVGRKDAWEKLFPRFRAVRDGIAPK
jgi:hypothetical protein